MTDPPVEETADVFDVLVVGAGPTGLVLALWLARAGVRVYVIDSAADAGTTSRALVVHARTLEFYRQLGIADAVVERGVRFAAANLWVGARRAARAYFGDIGAGVTPFPFMVIFPQDEHERLLIDVLRQAGVAVEREVACTALADNGAVVRATVRRADGHEDVIVARYVVGCDGAHSVTRGQIGATFPGGTYEHLFYVADVEARGPMIDGELHVALDAADLLAVFPMAGGSRGRLIGTVREDAVRAGRPLDWGDVHGDIVARMRMDVSRVNWFSTYHVHHRVADRFRRGRVFLAGDAAHIHSPVGAQGMNTGIGDAVNLAWKLAAVVRHGASPTLLDSYEAERRAFALQLVATTDRAFTFATRDGPIAAFVRRHVLPVLLAPAVRLNTVRRFMFRTLSQTAISYRHSVLTGAPGPGRAVSGVRAGDRLAWVPGRDGDNYAALESRAWQVHVYGVARPDLRAACDEAGLPVLEHVWSSAARQAGFTADTAYLIRPDGYVALVVAEGAQLGRYVAQWYPEGRPNG